jgi:hypothetical protein
MKVVQKAWTVVCVVRTIKMHKVIYMASYRDVQIGLYS